MSSLRDSLNLVVFHGLSPVSVMCSPLRGSFVIYVKISSLRDSLNLAVFHGLSPVSVMVLPLRGSNSRRYVCSCKCKKKCIQQEQR